MPVFHQVSSPRGWALVPRQLSRLLPTLRPAPAWDVEGKGAGEVAAEHRNYSSQVFRTPWGKAALRSWYVRGEKRFLTRGGGVEAGVGVVGGGWSLSEASKAQSHEEGNPGECLGAQRGVGARGEPQPPRQVSPPFLQV